MQFFPTHPSPTPLTESVVNICYYVQKFCISVCFFLIFFQSGCYLFELHLVSFDFVSIQFQLFPSILICLVVVVVVVELNLTCFQKSKLHRKICSELLIPHLFLPIFSFLSFESQLLFLVSDSGLLFLFTKISRYMNVFLFTPFSCKRWHTIYNLLYLLF